MVRKWWRPLLSSPVSSHFFSYISYIFLIFSKFRRETDQEEKERERENSLGITEFPSSGKERDITCSTGDLGRWEMIRRGKR